MSDETPAAQFTPGPWRYNSYNHILDAAGRDICFIPDHPTDGEYAPDESKERGAWYRESANNAHLIAIAPEMYGALRTAYLVLTTKTPDPSDCFQTAALIGALLNKADGHNV